MRTTARIELTFSESEFMTLAVAAYHANMPVSDWIKQQLLTSSTAPAPAAAPTTISTAVQALAPPAQPAEPPVAEPQTSDESTQREPEPEPAVAPAPAAPAALPSPSGGKKRKERKRTPDGVVPQGFEKIVGIGERIIAAREEISARLGSSIGYHFFNEMGAWYKDNDLVMPNHVRTQLSEIGKNAIAVRRWQSTLKEPLADDIGPYTLLRLWQQAETPADERTGTSGDETLIVEDGKLVRKSLSAHLAAAAGNGANGAAATPPPAPENHPDRFRAYSNFGEVDLDTLDNYDARALRRFTERIENLGGAREDIEEDKIALAIRKIRGSESGDNPPTAIALTRLCVISGRSGAYRIRREYVERFSDVKRWAMGVPA